MTAVRQFLGITNVFLRRDLKTRYRTSVLGWAWSLLNPLSTVIVYTIAFSIILRATAPPGGKADLGFGIYLLVGLVPWAFFSTCLNNSPSWMIGLSGLRQKIAFDERAPLIGIILAHGVQALLELSIALTFLVAFGNYGWSYLYLPLACALLLALTAGIILCILPATTRYSDGAYLQSVALNFLFFLTPVVYPPALVPDTAWGLPIRDILLLNPMYLVVGMFRDVLYHLRAPNLTHVLTLLSVSAALLVVGGRSFGSRFSEVYETL